MNVLTQLLAAKDWPLVITVAYLLWAIVACIGVYLPLCGSSRSAVVALAFSGFATTAWYLLGNPFGIDNMYVAAIAPALVFALDRVLPGGRPGAARVSEG